MSLFGRLKHHNPPIRLRDVAGWPELPPTALPLVGAYLNHNGALVTALSPVVVHEFTWPHVLALACAIPVMLVLNVWSLRRARSRAKNETEN